MSDREIPRDELAAMVRTVRPEWTVREAERARNGTMSIYRLTVETDEQRREAVLKATPDGDRYGIDTEARLLGIVRARTSIPVPRVLGAVERHDEVRTPFFLMESMPGTAFHRRDMERLSDATVERIARRSGRHLAELHGLDLVDAFGDVTCDRSDPLRGGRPQPITDRIVVDGPGRRWTAVVREWAENVLDRHSSTRFSDLTPAIRSAVDEHLDALSGPFRPVLGRIDNSLDNVLVDAERGEMTAMIDWAFTLAVTPAYDFVTAERNFTGGPWSMVPSASDYQPLVRDAMFDGFRSRAPDAAVERVREHYPLYEWLALLRSMNNLEAWMPGATPDQLDEAVTRYRTVVNEALER